MPQQTMREFFLKGQTVLTCFTAQSIRTASLFTHHGMSCALIEYFAEQGTSRGGADIRRIVQRLSLWGISMLFVVGGNGVCPWEP